MVAHVENVNLSAIYGIWLTKCAFFFFPSGPETVCSVIEVSGRPLLGSRGPHAIQPRPIAAPAGATQGRRAARAVWCGPGPGSGSDSDSFANSCEETKMPQALSADTNRYRIRIPKRTRRLWQRVLLIISPIAWTSLKQFVITRVLRILPLRRRLFWVRA